MSPTGAWYLMWHPDRPEEPQMLQAMNLSLALQICILPDDGRIQWFKSLEQPDMLTQVAAMEGDIDLVDVAVGYWSKATKNKKPRGKALECFKEAFGRSYQKHEAMALSDIVRLATNTEGLEVIKAEEMDTSTRYSESKEEKIKEIPPGEKLTIAEEMEMTSQSEEKPQEVPDGTGEEDKVIHSDDTPEDTGGEGNHGVRLGRPSWVDQERVVEEAEREPTMVALGDPRDPSTAEEKARRGG